MELTDKNGLENGFEAAMRKCKAINIAVGMLLALAVLIWLPALVMSIISLAHGAAGSVSTVAYLILYGVLVLGVLGTLKLIFRDIVKNRSPFSEQQADRLRFIAFLALMFVILEFAFTWGITYEVVPNAGYSVLINYGGTEPSTNINLGVLIFSAIMYSLSAIFRYAALLQQLSDETV